MGVILTQAVEGLPVGAEYTGPREDWHLAQGSARTKTGNRDRTNDSDVLPAKDPTLAKNREAPSKGLGDYLVETHGGFDNESHGGATTEPAGQIEDGGEPEPDKGESNPKGEVSDLGADGTGDLVDGEADKPKRADLVPDHSGTKVPTPSSAEGKPAADAAKTRKPAKVTEPSDD